VFKLYIKTEWQRYYHSQQWRISKRWTIPIEVRPHMNITRQHGDWSNTLLLDHIFKNTVQILLNMPTHNRNHHINRLDWHIKPTTLDWNHYLTAIQNIKTNEIFGNKISTLNTAMTTRHNPEPVQSNAHSQTYFLNVTFDIFSNILLAPPSFTYQNFEFILWYSHLMHTFTWNILIKWHEVLT
jgi:hypothetical protein